MTHLRFPWSAVDAGPRVSSLQPTKGPMAGGTRVTVSGSGFRSGSTKCQFGTLSPTSSTYISQTQIVCFSPAAGTDVSGSVALEVTADNSGSADTFSVRRPLHLSRSACCDTRVRTCEFVSLPAIKGAPGMGVGVSSWYSILSCMLSHFFCVLHSDTIGSATAAICWTSTGWHSRDSNGFRFRERC